MATSYTITGQEQGTELSPTGQLVQVMRVTFQTKPSSLIGILAVPLDVYAPEEVDRLAAARAEVMERVQAL